MQLLSSARADQAPQSYGSPAAKAETLVEAEAASQRSLVTRYGERMTSHQVAQELGYSHVYFTKKIGSEKHRHLEWVKALLPARVRLGAAYGYKTAAVEALMKERGLL